MLQVVLRYFMGYWPAKLPTLLNVVLMVGYTTIDCIIGGQVLSAVSGGSMTILVGVIVVAIVTLLIAVFGMAIFHRYERYASMLRCMSNIKLTYVPDTLGSPRSSSSQSSSAPLANTSTLPLSPP